MKHRRNTLRPSTALRAGLLASYITAYASSALAQHAVWIDVFTSCEQNVILQTEYFGQPIIVSPRKDAITNGAPYVLKELAGKA